MIKARNTNPGSVAKTLATNWWLNAIIPNVDSLNYYLPAGANNLNGAVVGQTITGTSFYTKVVQGVAVSIITAFGATSATFKITGENQFGETVSESLTFSATGTQPTTYAYRRITSVVLTALTGSFSGTATLAIGYAAPGTSPTYAIPLLAKIRGTGSVKAVFNGIQTTLANQPTFTVTLSPTWTIVLTNSTAGFTVESPLNVILDPKEAGL